MEIDLVGRRQLVNDIVAERQSIEDDSVVPRKQQTASLPDPAVSVLGCWPPIRKSVRRRR